MASFNISSLLSDTKTQLQKASLDKFGAAVEDFSKGKLTELLKKGSSTGTATSNRDDQNTMYAQSYAAALSGQSDYRPKLKFLFKVEFGFSANTRAAIKQIAGSDPQLQAAMSRMLANEFTFMVKSVERPKVDFEYDEDNNMYNFRTKALKRIVHRDLTIQFMDDVGNRVFDFFRILMAVHSPITRSQFIRDGGAAIPSSSKLKTGSGMSWILGQGAGANNANRAVVNSDFGQSIDYIRVKQMFADPNQGISEAAQMVAFDFVNPRIVSFDLDELSHEANDVNTLTMVFGYDWMEMVKMGSLNQFRKDYTESMYKIRANNIQTVPLDVMPGKPGMSNSKNAQGKQGLLSKVLGQQTDKYTEKLTSDVLSRGVTSVFGNGTVGKQLSGQVTSGLSKQLGGFVSGGLKERSSGLFNSFFSPGSKVASSGTTEGGTITASAASTDGSA